MLYNRVWFLVQESLCWGGEKHSSPFEGVGWLLRLNIAFMACKDFLLPVPRMVRPEKALLLWNADGKPYFMRSLSFASP